MPKWKKYSWRELPRKAVKRLARMAYYKQTLIFFSRPIASSTVEAELQVRNHRQHPEIVDILKKAYPKYVKVTDQRLRDGLILYCVFGLEDQLVASCWFALERFVDPMGHFVIPVASDEVYASDGKVEPEYRRNRVGSNGLLMIFNEMWHMGRKLAVTVVSDQNLPSLKAHHHLGFKEIGRKIQTHYVFGQPFNRYISYTPGASGSKVSSSQ